MKVSLNTVKQYTQVTLPVSELVAKINDQLGGVEGVTDLGERYKDAVIARVVQCNKHHNADKLSVCTIDVGGTESVQVVCGAPNVREGLFVVWLPPGATVPATATDAEPFVLGARELRGVMSHGMLASGKELGIGDDHDGILEIDPSEWKPTDVEIKPGTSFAKAYGLDDVVIDIENKMFTHRPDLFGQLGVAREIAGIQQKPFSSPDWYKVSHEFNSSDGLTLTVQNDASEKVPRFMAVAIQGVNVKPSPLWLRIELIRFGSKPINNIVDVTNYVMLLTGQPLHAYDYDKLAGGTLGVRMASDGEQVTLLNDKTYSLSTDDIVIVDGDGPVGLGGVMGGSNSEVSERTTNIVLECATFDMYAIRKTSMRHGLFTDAVSRFNKGQSPLQNAAALGLAMSFILDLVGGKQASNVYDDYYVARTDEIIDQRAYTVNSVRRVNPEVRPMEGPEEITVEFINSRLGTALSVNDIAQLLLNVEFESYEKTGAPEPTLFYWAPFWRMDIQASEDVVEEIGRLYGFDKLPRELPIRSVRPAASNPTIGTKEAIRTSLARAGANEVLTYSFVHEKLMKKAGQDVSQAFRLSNALSPDLQYYRLSVLPSLLDKVHANIKTGHDEFALFEIGKGHAVHNVESDGLPTETNLVELVYARKKPRDGAPYYVAQRIVRQLAKDLGIAVQFQVISDRMDYPGAAMFDLTRSALVMSGDEVLGIVGELKQSVIAQFKLPEYVAAATLDIQRLQAQYLTMGSSYVPLPRFPKVSGDISLQVSVDTTYRAVYDAAAAAIGTDATRSVSLVPVSLYQPPGGNTKTITLRLTVASYEKTLTDHDVTMMLDTVASASISLGAERV